MHKQRLFILFWSGSVSIPKQTYSHKHLLLMHLPPRQNLTELFFLLQEYVNVLRVPSV